MSGFVATTPQTSRNDDGTQRAWMRVGQEHYLRNLDGSFTQQETTFHDVIMFRRNAEKATDMFKKGDRIVAEGYPHTWQAVGEDGVKQDREEFVARHIGHDLAYTTYTVDRTPKVQQGPTNGLEHDLRPADAAQLIGMAV